MGFVVEAELGVVGAEGAEEEMEVGGWEVEMDEGGGWGHGACTSVLGGSDLLLVWWAGLCDE